MVAQLSLAYRAFNSFPVAANTSEAVDKMVTRLSFQFFPSCSYSTEEERFSVYIESFQFFPSCSHGS